MEVLVKGKVSPKPNYIGNCHVCKSYIEAKPYEVRSSEEFGDEILCPTCGAVMTMHVITSEKGKELRSLASAIMVEELRNKTSNSEDYT